MRSPFHADMTPPFAADTRSPTGGLAPYAQPMGRRQAAHLLRRAGFSARAGDASGLVGRSAGDVVDKLVDGALTAPLPDPPAWSSEPPPDRTAPEAERMEYQQRNAEHVMELTGEWFQLMRSHGLRERMTLFWHNHFVTSIDTYHLAPFAYRYLALLRANCLGSFRDFVHAVGTDAAMLIYLNGTQNRSGAPNENYARELLELFTMGITGPDGAPNYVDSQNPPGDVQEIARALTGWVVDPWSLSVSFIPFFHDAGEKTIFGQNGQFGYDAVIDLIFQERSEAVAHFVCRKLYREFIYEEPDETIVGELAAAFQASDFDIAAVVRLLLKSERFFDDEIVAARIKSPVEMIVGMINEIEVDFESDELLQANRLAGILAQRLLSPPNVAGWPGHRAWIDTTTFPIRWLAADLMIFGQRGVYGTDARAVAEAVTDPEWDSGGKWLSPFLLPVAIAEHLLAAPLEDASIESMSDQFAGDLETFPIPQEVLDAPPHVRNLAKIFLAGAPWYEWRLEADGAETLLQAYIRYLAHLPEYQLA